MFKEKTSKKRIHVNDSSKDSTTLDARHTSMINTLQDNKSSIDVLTLERQNLLTNISDIEEQIKQFKIDGDIESENYNLSWSSNLLLNEKVKDIDSRLHRLRSYQDEIEYYENTGNILFKYYDLIDKQNVNTNLNNVINVVLPPPTRVIKSRKKQQLPVSINILDAFKINSNSQTNLLQKEEEEKEPTVDKATLVMDYLSHIDPNVLRSVNNETLGICPRCTAQLVCIQPDGIMVCSDCGGYQESLLVEQNRPLLRQPNKEASHFSYKRINHFREWCSQVQGKESTDIPEDIFERILQEIKKEKIQDTRKITYNKMREILKKLRINKYYEHINYIINRINGVATPHFSPELEDKLCSMFKEIQGPFLRHCPKDRKNFLSYSYCLFKLFQILGMHEYLSLFSLLKSREKLQVQDTIFRKICDDLGWPFYPSL